MIKYLKKPSGGTLKKEIEDIESELICLKSHVNSLEDELSSKEKQLKNLDAVPYRGRISSTGVLIWSPLR